LIKILNIKYIFKHYLSIKLVFAYLKYLLVFFFLFYYIKNINNNFLTKLKKDRNFTKDWFTRNIYFWLILLKKNNLLEKKIKILEIGTYEGFSAVFILSILKNSNLTIVDTFKGGPEQKGVSNFVNLKKKFSKNIKKFTKRTFVHEGSSDSFFQINRNKFDFIYIDGAHDYKSVLKDSINSFKCLRQNGLLIFDDYFWRFYEYGKNPISAINSFLRKIKGRYKIEFLTTQLAIKKIA
jgi:predicted O-methyltransferase YrrM